MLKRPSAERSTGSSPDPARCRSGTTCDQPGKPKGSP
jgi:hypothetical protein